VREVYQNEEDANVVDDALETMVGKEARRMLAAALEEEVSAFLGRDRYERDDEFRGYRNGDHPSREFTVGVTVVEVKAPRVRDVPAEVSTDGFESKIVKERPPLSGVVLLSKSPVCFRMRVAVSEGAFLVTSYMRYKHNFNAFRNDQKERPQQALALGVFATIAAPNTPTGAGVYADRCNPSGGPPAGYELLFSRHPRRTPGAGRLIRQRGSSLISSVPVSLPMS